MKRESKSTSFGVDREVGKANRAFPNQRQEPQTRIQPTPLIELLRLQEQALRRVLMPPRRAPE